MRGREVGLVGVINSLKVGSSNLEKRLVQLDDLLLEGLRARLQGKRRLLH